MASNWGHKESSDKGDTEDNSPFVNYGKTDDDHFPSKQKRKLLRSEEIYDCAFDNEGVKSVGNNLSSIPDVVTYSPTQDGPPQLQHGRNSDDTLPDVISLTEERNYPSLSQEDDVNETSRAKGGILKKKEQASDKILSQSKNMDTASNFRRSVSFHEQAKSGEERHTSSGEAEFRRKSYRDSGYGSDESKAASTGSQNQEADVFSDFDCEKHSMDMLMKVIESKDNVKLLEDIPNLSILNSADLTPTNSQQEEENKYSQEIHNLEMNNLQKNNSKSALNKQEFIPSPQTYEPKGLPCLSVFNENQPSSMADDIGGNIPCVSMLNEGSKPPGSMNNGSMQSNVSAGMGLDSSVCIPGGLDISGLPDSSSFQTHPSYQHVFKHYIMGEKISISSRDPRSAKNSIQNEDDNLPRSPFSMLIQMILSTPALLEKHLQDPAGFLKLLDFHRPSSSSTTHTPSPFIPNAGTTQQTQGCEDNDLEYICRCRDSLCSDARCNKIREAVVGLRHALDGVWSVRCSPEIQQVFQALHAHTQRCEEQLYKCTVPKCHIFSEKNFNPEVDEMSQFIKCCNVPYLSLGTKFDDYLIKGEFTQLCAHVSSDNMPDSDVILITTFGDYGNVAMFTEESVSADSKSYILKRICKKNYDDMNSVAEIYKRLQGKEHPHITPHLWLHNTADFLYVCMDFLYGGSLEEYLNTRSFLRPDEATYIIQQLLEAVIYLHHLKVIYLYWTASNILFRDTSRSRVYLSNLSMSVSKDVPVDVGFLKTGLPPCIVPPEILTETSGHDLKLDDKSDVWGIGCLYAEMLTGKQMWYNLRHSRREELFNKVVSGDFDMFCPSGHWGKVPQNLSALLKDHCWKSVVKERITAPALQQKLSNEQ